MYLLIYASKTIIHLCFPDLVSSKLPLTHAMLVIVREPPVTPLQYSYIFDYKNDM